MKERPILFSAPMVRALLAGTKTQTRRALRNGTWWTPEHGVIRMAPAGLACTGCAHVACPYGVPGDRLWVRETWRITGASPEDTLDMFDRGDVQYRADGDQSYIDKYRPSIHMPRRFSRITLEVTGVRVERLQDISRGDAMAEGCPFQNMAHGDDPRVWYEDLWRDLHGADSWDANPWAWVVEFKRLEG